MNPLLTLERITGGYTAGKPAIHDISFTVQAGEIVGLIGLNGAGKSTILKHVLGFLQPSSGTISFSTDRQPLLAYVPETPELYEELTLWEHLQFMARAYQMEEQPFQERAERLLELFRLAHRAHHFPSSFSKGMRQKVMILCAFLVKPDVLVVDEPFVGLDPLATETLLGQLTELKKEGTAILLSTHVLGLAETYVDRFVVVHDGRIALYGTLPEMRSQAGLPQASLDDLFLSVVRR
ncbi:ABC transporter ATP-binding protein [Brevibacillus ruminantium]|uniref:ABC transporter ATP-binding protein n=1 Tax=Brevibacillus ruminantium TaxID=2950604 RepID=A0ABY4WFM9_9BACL|nr:ABC transporter ATP-binding protein [Brevibacillus ruminantium]USG65549.1 ABC transporter ATP-binding protein [Brevibacillus ruminantium]